MQTRRLTPADASVFQALRLAALQDTPSAFGSNHEEKKDFPAAKIQAWLAVPFGAFNNDELVGLVALGREDMRQLAHKALIWGMHVTPEVRGKGVARALLTDALSLARSVPDTRQVNLSVNANNAVAIRLYESVGFKASGREPGAMFINGRLHDELHMCLCFADV